MMPTYNEAYSLSETVIQLLGTVKEVDVLIVDDNSPDGTAGIAMKLAETSPRVRVLNRASKLGLGPAYLEGFQYALANKYQLIVEMDADGSHRADDLNKILEAAQDADLVIGSRWMSGGAVNNWPLSRRLLSRGGNVFARMMLGTQIQDMTSGFRAYRADFLEKLIALPLSSKGYSFQVELAYRANQEGKVVEVPITFVEREEGKSKMTLGIVIEALLKIQLWGLKRFFS